MRRVLRRCVFLAGSFLTFSGIAHQDPIGDIHPYVSVENGKFAVSFSNSDRGTMPLVPMYRMIFDRDGELFLPRHAIEEERVRNIPAWYGGTVRFHDGNNYRIDGSAMNLRVESESGEVRSYVLPWENGKCPFQIFEDFAVAEKLYLLGTIMGDSVRDPEFFLAEFDLNNLRTPLFKKLGRVETIYDFPVCSPLVVDGDRVAVAWMGKPAGEEGRAFVLSTLDPDTGEIRSRSLDADPMWNTSISMASIRGRLCIAWHTGSIYGRFEKARIETLFVDLAN